MDEQDLRGQGGDYLGGGRRCVVRGEFLGDAAEEGIGFVAVIALVVEGVGLVGDGDGD